MFFCRGGRAGCGPISDLRPLTSAERGRSRGFTLLELLIVVGIIGLLLVLMAPAFTYIKGGTDVTSAAYTIKGVLDTARTYAKANNTYTQPTQQHKGLVELSCQSWHPRMAQWFIRRH